MDEVSACRDLEHVDLAAELQVLCALLSGLLDLILAFRRPHAQVLDGRKGGALWGPDDHVGPGLHDLSKCPLAAFVFAEIRTVHRSF